MSQDKELGKVIRKPDVRTRMTQNVHSDATLSIERDGETIKRAVINCSIGLWDLNSLKLNECCNRCKDVGY